MIENALDDLSQDDLVTIIMELVIKRAEIVHDLEDLLSVETPSDLLIDDVKSAIARATDFDKRMMNYNFEVDWEAYAQVEKWLAQLVERGHLEDAKSLALMLMKKGSYQVECSDEGLMSEEISACLKPVIRAVQAHGGDEARQWASEMKMADRVGFICAKELTALEESTSKP